ncbi:hypothetical protein glysoja_028053 [Glycine soja]|uniref:Uncharacterized protein n=1 Tax=Glycine soja TaxID=3848 RepID=A0A0B2P741_GLYSO|nr:hypothetical protein JHK87_035081 [Glycine soja]KHN05155.1 hypothetical protein glysoja_028053 [Glycine soja]
MGPALVTIDLDDYDDVREIPKPKGPNSEDYRLERRWKRFEHSSSNKRLKQNHSDSGTRTVKSHGKVASLTVKEGHMSHMSEDEVDEDYKFFLLTYDPHIDVVCDGGVDGSDDDINIGHNSDHNDHLYREEESLNNNPKLDKGSKQRGETENERNKRSGSVGKQTSGSMKAKKNLEAKKGLSKKMPREDVSGVPKNNGQTNMESVVADEDYQIFLNSCRDDYIPSELIGKRSSVMQNSQVLDYAPSEVDEDYLQYLNSVLIVDGEVEFMSERNTSKTDNVDGDTDSNSSEPDVILLEPDQIHENTPFVSSRTFDSSWFETEKNPKGNWQLSACDNSQFRRRLMNDLQRPYDQEEYDRLLCEVRQKKQKERHRETRHGVVKSYPTRGFHKSYLDLYPDLAKAIAEFKKPERVLFLVRGFVFWLQVRQ